MLLERLRRAQVTWERVAAVMSSGIIMVMMLLTTADVILRYVFRKPLPETYTLCEFMMVGIVYLAIAYVQQKKGHVTMELLIGRVHGRPRTGIELAMLTIGLVTFACVTWQSAQFFWRALVEAEVSPGIVNYPTAPVKVLIPIGTAILTARLVTDIVDKLAEWRQSSPVKRDVVPYLCIIVPVLLLVGVLYYSPFEVSRPLAGWVSLGLMMLLMFLGLPVAYGLATMGLFGFAALSDAGKGLAMISSVMYTKVAFYTLTVMPLFVLMGHFAFHAGFVRDVFHTASKWFGRVPGGLAQATVVGGAALAAACGSGVAAAAVLSKICIPPMRREGINPRLAVGTVASIGPIATMIPPSITMVAYGFLTEQSIARLLIAGVLPGLLFAGLMMVQIFLLCKLNPNLAPLPKERISWKERLVSLKGIWGISVIVLIVIGGIYAGIFTPTEAGALGAFGALMLGLAVRRIKWANLKESLMEASRVTGMMFFIIATAFVYMHFLGITRLPSMASDFLIAMEMPRIYVLLAFIIFYSIAGCFLDMLAVMFLTLPFIFPVMAALGYDPIWFGVVTVFMTEISMITPPFGLTLFAVKGTVGDVTMQDVIVGSAPFVATYYVALALIIIFPEIATFLPSLM